MMIHVRIFLVLAHRRTEPNVCRLLRHCIQMLRIPRVGLTLRIRWVMQVIGMITIHMMNSARPAGLRRRGRDHRSGLQFTDASFLLEAITQIAHAVMAGLHH
jgi:hypothetical protein